MFLIFIILSLNTCIPPHHAQHIFPTESYHLMYGKLFNVKKTFLPMDGLGFTKDQPKVIPNITMNEALSDLYMIYDVDKVLNQFNTSSKRGHDVDQFNQLNLQVLNLTQDARKRLWLQNNDWWWTDPSDPEKHKPNDYAEERKKRRLNEIGLTYLIHTRYLMDGAMKQRKLIRGDKRYKMGYLFNRLRRIKTEMLKVVRIAQEANAVWWTKRIMVALRLYEEVIRMDMDVRDTTWLIKDIFKIAEPYDYDDAPKNKNEFGSQNMNWPPDGPPPEFNVGQPS